jgi:hypothetical protein
MIHHCEYPILVDSFEEDKKIYYFVIVIFILKRLNLGLLWCTGQKPKHRS